MTKRAKTVKEAAWIKNPSSPHDLRERQKGFMDMAKEHARQHKKQFADMTKNVMRELQQMMDLSAPAEDKIRGFQSLAGHFNEAAKHLQETYFPETKKSVDLSSIPLYPGKRQSGIDGREWLKTHYGSGLKSCGAPENLFYREEIKDHDQKLVRRIAFECEQAKIPYCEVIPTRRDKTDEKAKSINPEDIKTVKTLMRRSSRPTPAYRQHRKDKALELVT
jgi:soluble cytochrome b562